MSAAAPRDELVSISISGAAATIQTDESAEKPAAVSRFIELSGATGPSRSYGVTLEYRIGTTGR